MHSGNSTLLLAGLATAITVALDHGRGLSTAQLLHELSARISAMTTRRPAYAAVRLALWQSIEILVDAYEQQTMASRQHDPIAAGVFCDEVRRFAGTTRQTQRQLLAGIDFSSPGQQLIPAGWLADSAGPAQPPWVALLQQVALQDIELASGLAEVPAAFRALVIGQCIAGGPLVDQAGPGADLAGSTQVGLADVFALYLIAQLRANPFVREAVLGRDLPSGSSADRATGGTFEAMLVWAAGQARRLDDQLRRGEAGPFAGQAAATDVTEAVDARAALFQRIAGRRLPPRHAYAVAAALAAGRLVPIEVGQEVRRIAGLEGMVTAYLGEAAERAQAMMAPAAVTGALATAWQQCRDGDPALAVSTLKVALGPGIGLPPPVAFDLHCAIASLESLLVEPRSEARHLSEALGCLAGEHFATRQQILLLMAKALRRASLETRDQAAADGATAILERLLAAGPDALEHEQLMEAHVELARLQLARARPGEASNIAAQVAERLMSVIASRAPAVGTRLWLEAMLAGADALLAIPARTSEAIAHIEAAATEADGVLDVIARAEVARRRAQAYTDAVDVDPDVQRRVAEQCRTAAGYDLEYEDPFLWAELQAAIARLSAAATTAIDRGPALTAFAALKGALRVVGPDVDADLNAALWYELGGVCVALAGQREGVQVWQDRAIDCYRQAIAGIGREHDPRRWGWYHHRMATALLAANATSTDGAARLSRQALAAANQAVKGLAMAAGPSARQQAERLLGRACVALGKSTGNARWLKQAVAELKGTLPKTTATETEALAFATTWRDLGEALRLLGTLQGDAQLIVEAEEGQRAARAMIAGNPRAHKLLRELG